MLVVGFLGGVLIFGEDYGDNFFGEEIAEKQIEDYSVFSTVLTLAEIGIYIVLIRKWSKEWNAKVSENY